MNQLTLPFSYFDLPLGLPQNKKNIRLKVKLKEIFKKTLILACSTQFKALDTETLEKCEF